MITERAMNTIARPNAYKDTPTLERWINWCHPEVWTQFEYAKPQKGVSFWYWLESEHPTLLDTFKQLTWRD